MFISCSAMASSTTSNYSSITADPGGGMGIDSVSVRGMDRLRRLLCFRGAGAEAIEVRLIEDMDRLVHFVLQRVR
jgi:hypothetical protein